MSDGWYWAAVAWGPGVVSVVCDGAGWAHRVVLGPGPVPLGRKGGPAGEVLRQMIEYLSGRRRGFDVPCVLPSLETFTGRVLAGLADVVPYGQVATYGQVAAAFGRPAAARAVGRAMAANPCPILIPCHRVVGARDLGGFGPGRVWKQALLALEGVERLSGRVERRAGFSGPNPSGNVWWIPCRS